MTNPYELWSTRKSLGVFRATKPETFYFGQFFTSQMRSTDEWIDFEKLPVRARHLAPFVKPMGRGKGFAKDSVQGYRFKPANLVVEDAVDPFRPLTMQPGIDSPILDGNGGNIDPMTRLNLIKAQMLADMRSAVERRWEWMKARAIIDGKVTCTYLDGTSVLVDFQRDSGHTEVLTSGNYWGDAGVSILDKFSSVADTMANADFGGVPTRATMGGSVATVIRNAMKEGGELHEHIDLTLAGGLHRVDRGLTPTGKVYKFGEFFFGGGSGQMIELWVNNETYTADDGTTTRYLGANEVIFTSTPDAVNGYECFGRIVDKDAAYQALPVFVKNFETGERTKVENLSAESAPLFVPINPDATYKLTPVAA